MLRLLPLRRPVPGRRGTRVGVAAASSLGRRPAPPPLPPKQQADFERLQRQAATGSGSDSAPPAPRPDDFAGPVNPRTGEVGGPKKEPLRWGPDGDWSYNGRVTDF